LARFGSATQTLAPAAAWAVEHELLEVTDVVTEADASAARELRSSLVTLLLDHADETVGTASVDEAELYLRQVGDHYLLRTEISRNRARLLAATGGVPGLLSSVLAAASNAWLGGQWGLIKACVAPTCQLGFIDRTRNHSGRYCSPRCGARMSMQSVRARRRTAPQ
jgi:predicted RNA-binding Zn ribbon-like protein